jgi:hypothetical protein
MPVPTDPAIVSGEEILTPTTEPKPAVEEAPTVEAEAEEAEETEPQEEVEEKRPKSGYARAKIKLDRAYQRITALEERLAEREKTPEPEEKEPKIEDFNGDYLAHQNAMAAYWAAKGAGKAVDKRLEEFITTQTQQRQQDQYRSAVSEFNDRLHEEAEQFGIQNIDNDANVLMNELGAFPPTIRGAMFRMESSAPVVHYLASNLDYAADLYGKTPEEQLFELGKLEAKLSLPEARKATKAPPAFKTPRGGASPPKDIASVAARSEDISDYIKARQAKKD